MRQRGWLRLTQAAEILQTTWSPFLAACGMRWPAKNLVRNAPDLLGQDVCGPHPPVFCKLHLKGLAFREVL